MDQLRPFRFGLEVGGATSRAARIATARKAVRAVHDSRAANTPVSPDDRHTDQLLHRMRRRIEHLGYTVRREPMLIPAA